MNTIKQFFHLLARWPLRSPITWGTCALAPWVLGVNGIYWQEADSLWMAALFFLFGGLIALTVGFTGIAGDFIHERNQAEGKLCVS